MYTLILVFLISGGWDVKAMHTQNVVGFQSEQLCEQARAKVKAPNMTILGYCMKTK